MIDAESRRAVAAAIVACLLQAQFSWCTEAHGNQTTSPKVEVSFDIWDWTAPARDLALFDQWASDLQACGVNRVELSVPWNQLEPEPGRIDLKFIKDRQAICKKRGLGMWLRINSYCRGATPTWYKGDLWHGPDGKLVSGATSPPSIADERFWASYAPLCTTIARDFRGEDMYYNAFIGIHAELKWADWWSFDPSCMALWRESIRAPRPAWLRRVVADDAALPDTPSVPGLTDGLPDTSPANVAFIAFREWLWRRAAERFAAAIHAGDPDARVSSPLGESFRSESASMSNLDYWGLSRGSSQVCHSYDFFIHPGSTPQWHIGATIAAFQGITGLPVCFEFDSPGTIQNHGYTEPIQIDCARTAVAAGAGLKFANFSYADCLPSSLPLIARSGELAAHGSAGAATASPPGKTVLLFFSKWANYCYREKTEWLHDAQFGWWKLLTDLGVPVRIICEDNLGEDLRGYRGIVLAFSPRCVMPQADRDALARLTLPRIEDMPTTPALQPREPELLRGDAGQLALQASLPFVSVADLSALAATHQFALKGSAFSLAACKDGEVALGFPLGYFYLHGSDANACLAVARYALKRAFPAAP